ncbi:probable calcium-binding CML45 [Olea europaea subsp. europaea]|uniref:Probable calcium-binding CML45 n=1 Tax=Olea europaea subsp. europaea TaxID=158383 RepID=A0A8S0RXG7_OLEEU|nr:probable calcium-binding CML45 [Olea europaea subsp. europaea]
MELTQANAISSLILFLNRILCWDIEKLFVCIHFFLHTFPKFVSTKWKLWRKSIASNSEQSNKESRIPESSINVYFQNTELNMVMDRLNIVCTEDGEGSIFGVAEFSVLFDEEPSLQEVKETFDVFDAKKDGFIDANELQRVLCSLGLKEGCELEECRRMIRAFDENGDGLIDFIEFVKFMEKYFS